MLSELHARLTKLTPVLLRYVVALYALVRDRPTQVATGFILRAQGGHYLVTAAHVLNDLPAGEHLFFYSDTRQLRYVEGLTFVSDESLDVAVVQLSTLGVASPELQAGTVAIGPELLAPGRDRDDAQYLVIGYPNSKNRRNPVAAQLALTPWAFVASSLSNPSYSERGLDPVDHLLLEFDRDNGFNGEGERIAMPKPQGVSGAPIWMLYGDRYDDGTTGPVIVGIATHHRAGWRAVQGTDIQVAIDAVMAMILDPHIAASVSRK